MVEYDRSIYSVSLGVSVHDKEPSHPPGEGGEGAQSQELEEEEGVGCGKHSTIHAMSPAVPSSVRTGASIDR